MPMLVSSKCCNPRSKHWPLCPVRWNRYQKSQPRLIDTMDNRHSNYRSCRCPFYNSESIADHLHTAPYLQVAHMSLDPSTYIGFVHKDNAMFHWPLRRGHSRQFENCWDKGPSPVERSTTDYHPTSWYRTNECVQRLHPHKAMGRSGSVCTSHSLCMWFADWLHPNRSSSRVSPCTWSTRSDVVPTCYTSGDTWRCVLRRSLICRF